MFKRLYHRWRYKRLPLFDYKQNIKYLQWFERYHRLFNVVPIKNFEYRTRVKFTVETKTNNLGELIILLDKIVPVVKNRLEHLDTTVERYAKRQKRSLDGWLVDINGLPYTEENTGRILLIRTSELYCNLMTIKKEDPSLYAYYNQGLIYVIQDILELIDTLLAMQLSVKRVYTEK